MCIRDSSVGYFHDIVRWHKTYLDYLVRDHPGAKAIIDEIVEGGKVNQRLQEVLTKSAVVYNWLVETASEARASEGRDTPGNFARPIHGSEVERSKEEIQAVVAGSSRCASCLGRPGDVRPVYREEFQAGVVWDQRYYEVILREPPNACCAMPLCTHCAAAPEIPCFCATGPTPLSPFVLVSFLKRLYICQYVSGKLCVKCWKPKTAICNFDGLYRCATDDLGALQYPRCHGSCVCRPLASAEPAEALSRLPPGEITQRCTSCNHESARACPGCNLAICSACALTGRRPVTLKETSNAEWNYQTCLRHCRYTSAVRYFGVSAQTQQDVSDAAAAAKRPRVDG